ncbi:MAG: hypothetical protein IRZ33_08050, partial [Alicyclobacillaceae bacterium]|nr:hypothetical protein [Alicyclobacillaceae bacterium]
MRIHIVFNIGYIRFSNIDSASAVNFGQSLQQDWHSISKTNTGYGKITGDRNWLERNRALVQDPDGADLLAAEDLRFQGKVRGPRWVYLAKLACQDEDEDSPRDSSNDRDGGPKAHTPYPSRPSASTEKKRARGASVRSQDFRGQQFSNTTHRSVTDPD